jgi:hypothetical protein
MDKSVADLRVECASRVSALVNAIRSIPPGLAPVKRASTQAIREQIYYGYEVPLSSARGGERLWGKYEHDRPWSVAAASLVRSGAAERGKRQLNREHVWEIADTVTELLAQSRSPEDTADLLDTRLVTCTVLAEEHARLGRVPKCLVGWERYEHAGIPVSMTFPS